MNYSFVQFVAAASLLAVSVALPADYLSEREFLVRVAANTGHSFATKWHPGGRHES
jgi:hypothetical protein